MRQYGAAQKQKACSCHGNNCTDLLEINECWILVTPQVTWEQQANPYPCKCSPCANAAAITYFPLDNIQGQSTDLDVLETDPVAASCNSFNGCFVVPNISYLHESEKQIDVLNLTTSAKTKLDDGSHKIVHTLCIPFCEKCYRSSCRDLTFFIDFFQPLRDATEFGKFLTAKISAFRTSLC